LDACDESNEAFPFCLDNLSDYDWPSPPQGDVVLDNHTNSFDRSVYALARVNFGGAAWQGHQLALHIGARYDDSSEVGSAPTQRIGGVYQFENWTVKLLYGESFNSPAGRELYGGWQASGSSPELKPETAETTELSATYQREQWQVSADVYAIQSNQNIVTFAGGAKNLGERTVQGIDLHANTQFTWGANQFKLWAYWTHLFETTQSIPYFVDAECTDITQCEVAFYEEDIGDSAVNKWWLGLTWRRHSQWSLTLRGRLIGARDTVSTNPIDQVEAYSTWDINTIWRNALSPGMDIGFSINNLTDERYFHPGLRQADAGTQVGQFDHNGVWQGSAGWYSSLLPQPGRQWLVHFTWRY
jgi:outer membrane receptor protein involved in Fe transport